MHPDRDPPPVAAVLVPVKAFGRAKGRLAEVLDDDARARLARAMADRVEASYREMAAGTPLQRVALSKDFYSGRADRLYEIAENLTVHLEGGNS